MTRLSAFRLLVVVSVVFYLAWMLLPYAPREFPPTVRDLLVSGGYGGSPWVVSPTFYLSLGAAKVAASVGLFWLQSWGRWLLLAVVVIGLASAAFAGISVSVPLDNIVAYCATLTDGAILAIAFCSPIAEALRKSA